MAGSVTIFKVRGIEVRLHWTLVLVFLLVAWSLAGGYLPLEYPGMGPATRWAVGLVTSVLFFASILLHELGHARAAAREGTPVRSITLFIFGGVAEIGESAKSPGAEFRVAVGGPLVTLALVVLFSVLDRLFAGVPVVDAPARWLARINLALLLFNLIPGFPLDGGRVLRAAVWQLTGSEERGWQAAFASGQIFAFALVGWGIWSVVQGDVGNGLWFALIGWFLQNAAASERASATLSRQLAGTTVAQAMGLTVEPTIPSRTSVHEAVEEQVLARGQGVFLVVDGGVPQGVVTLRDLTAVPREQWDATPVAEVMTPWARLRRVAPGTDLMAALHLMDAGRYGQLPVVEGDRVVGLLTREEVLHFLRLRSQVGG